MLVSAASPMAISQKTWRRVKDIGSFSVIKLWAVGGRGPFRRGNP
jgi:hypothetical protein